MKKRDTNLDFVKAIAIIFVLLQHSINDIFGYAKLTSFTKHEQVFYVLFLNLAKVAVPFFLIASGFFMYRSNDDFKAVLKKRILPLWLAFILWTIILRFIYGELNNIIPFIKEILFLKQAYHVYLWYIPMLIGLYLISPLVSKWLKSMQKKDFNYLFCLVLFFAAINAISNYLILFNKSPIKANLGLNLLAFDYLLFTIYGFYYVIYQNNSNKRKSLYLSLSLFILLFLKYFVMWSRSVSPSFSTEPLGILFIISFFDLLYSLDIKVKETKFIGFVSKNTLGIYFIHRPVLRYLAPRIKSTSLIVSSFQLFIVGTIVSVLLVYILKKIKIPYLV